MLTTTQKMVVPFGTISIPEQSKKIIGEILEGLREAQAAGEVSTREEALAWVEKQLKKEGS